MNRDDPHSDQEQSLSALSIPIPRSSVVEQCRSLRLGCSLEFECFTAQKAKAYKNICQAYLIRRVYQSSVIAALDARIPYLVPELISSQRMYKHFKARGDRLPPDSAINHNFSV
jgi:hypothetical protein